MRFLVLLLGVVSCAFGCSGLGQCSPGTCPQGEHCVYVGTAAVPACITACDLNADAGCPSGQRCGCGSSCQGCKNCVAVCQ